MLQSWQSPNHRRYAEIKKRTSLHNNNKKIINNIDNVSIAVRAFITLLVSAEICESSLERKEKLLKCTCTDKCCRDVLTKQLYRLSMWKQQDLVHLNYLKKKKILQRERHKNWLLSVFCFIFNISKIWPHERLVTPSNFEWDIYLKVCEIKCVNGMLLINCTMYPL